ncbi:TetR/AcrR family transcriptional regulator [Candidatus Xianfuyuplasma coldseepsis]|uniref:TetR/AcrR family transcriptional regulator n=1 Tax=Candidatus Xianfuyuplasma coldseepsis TaxID=2782163 RepID=A0A7L7KRG9_9MOLU|nr:TetR/AcrR family transcriptional regulator [Xianfuyuplasma coldseepsis]QMS84544.1 TetR/AcrR family transcriptional regulator [Xianfuyuplasma coldseepsis]
MSEFLQHDDARKNRILEAALAEFAEKGYKKASTNSIVREAKVSKGLLFHYFISKKELYIYLHQYAVDTITKELYEGVNFADRDVLNRLSASTVQKIDSYNKHPLFVQLFENHVFVEDEEIQQRTNAYSQQVAKDSYDKLFSNIDYFLFNDKININHALEVVKWTIDRISKDWVVKHNFTFKPENYDSLVEEIDVYLDLFRASFYK